MARNSKKFNFWISLLAVILLWLAWLVAYFFVRNDYVLPSFWGTMEALFEALRGAAFWRAFGGTMLRTLYAFLISVCGGVLLATASSLRTWVRSFLSPIISVLRTVPTLAIILVLLLWTTPRIAPVIVTVLVLLPAVYAAALAAADETAAAYGSLLSSFRVPAARRAFGVYLPCVAPEVLSQAGSFFSMGLKITVSGEVLANTFHSLGGLMQEAKMFVDMPTLLALTLVTVLTGFALEGLCLLLKKLLVRWRACD